jgi:hypothetical protein
MGKFTLSSTERLILSIKCEKLGFSKEKAKDRIDSISSYLKALKEKLKKKGVSEEDINSRFKKEFEKMCQQLEAER